MSRKHRKHTAVIGFYVGENGRIAIENDSLENLVYTYNRLVLDRRSQVREFNSIINEITERVKASIANGIFIGLVKVKL